MSPRRGRPRRTFREGLLEPARPCPSCDGEGYRYIEQAGRHSAAPVAEIRCERCHGTGLETP